MNEPDVTKRFVTRIKFLYSSCRGDGMVRNGRHLALSVIVNMKPEPTIKLQILHMDTTLP